MMKLVSQRHLCRAVFWQSDSCEHIWRNYFCMSNAPKDSVNVSPLRTTVVPVTPGDFSDTAKEFGRTKDVERIFSVKRGTLYNAEKLGLVRGVLLRLRGQKSGIKLWDMRSIENWIRGEMQKP
jgi:hypothetical protein